MNVNFINSDCNIVNCGKKNMELDLQMLERAVFCHDDFASIRFYNWSPKCISLGRNQKFDISENSYGIDVVRRPTGGRALLHDRELTYCVVMPIDDKKTILESYKDISDALILGFKKLGIELSYSSDKLKNLSYCMNISCGADVSYMGRKLIGSAQFRKEGYLLQHGSIMYDADFGLIEKIFKQKADKKSLVTLSEINSNISQIQLIEALKEGFIQKFSTLDT